jgi:predicted Ser/Thr protein kinase
MPRLDPGPEFLALQEAVAGRFSLVRELGRGGMGMVFLARDLSLDRLVAIKLLPPDAAASPTARERFLAEARTAAGLAHPHIVPIHSVEVRDGLAFFVMAFVDGETLGERVRRAGALPVADAIRVIQEVAWALGHAHARGVVHRDVKPDNVLLDRESGRAMVTDFGIAHALGVATPQPGVVLGTPQYVSPEVAQGATGDARSDLYSLGVTAWVAIAGRLPFEGASPAALLLAHVQSPVPSLAHAAPDLPPRLVAAIDRCLAKDVDARWASADAFAAELDAARIRAPMVPAPQRAFLREWERVGSEVATAGTAAIVASVDAVGMFVVSRLGVIGGGLDILAWIFALIAILAGGLAKARILQLASHARAMRARGVDHRRIVAALARESSPREEERASLTLAERAQHGRQRWILAGTILGGALCFPLAIVGGPPVVNMLGIAGAVVLPTLALRTAAHLLAPGGRERWWTRVLRGAFGRWLFRRGSDRSSAPGASTLEGPEPTAVALGGAARELFAALPPAARADLGEGMPDLIEALERRALEDAEAVARGDERAAAALHALEALRLDLLRLTVGTLTAPDLTAALERVRQLGRDVDRRLAAQEEVEDLLVRERTPT